MARLVYRTVLPHSTENLAMRRSLLLGVLLGLVVSSARAEDWPQWLGPKRDGVWRESGILDKFPANGPPVRWRTPIGSGYTGPAVAGGKVYLADRVLADGSVNPASGFTRNVVNGKERVLCLDEANGKILWKHEYPCTYEISYPAGPRCTPTVHDGKVYALGAMGDLVCLEADTGKLLWAKNFIKDYDAPTPVWGFCGHPLVDGKKLICLVGGARDAVAVAFDKDTGKELWKALAAKEPGYCPPMIFDLNGKRQLIIWHPEAVNGLDPETGKVLWSHPWRLQSGLAVPTPRLDGTRLFLTAFYNGAIMLDLKDDKPTVLWQSKFARSGKGEKPEVTDTLHAIMPAPWIKDGHIYGVCSYGELRCLEENTGKRIWESLQATGSTKGGKDRWNNAFIIPHEDRYFLWNERGDLIIARLSPKGYEEISRAHLLNPDNGMAGRPVNWVHPAFANKCMYVRNDREIIAVNLAK
jgi:outer membrane protein assembly factor BamB